jgi:predicted DNA-binding protein
MNTNVTISDEQMEKIKAISEQTGVAVDDFVREAIDRMIVDKTPKTGDWKQAVRAFAGIWKDRDDLEDLIREGREQLKQRHKRLYPDE